MRLPSVLLQAHVVLHRLDAADVARDLNCCRFICGGADESAELYHTLESLDVDLCGFQRRLTKDRRLHFPRDGGVVDVLPGALLFCSRSTTQRQRNDKNADQGCPLACNVCHASSFALDALPRDLNYLTSR